MIAQDFAALDALLSEDVVYIHSTAVAEDKQAYLAGVRNGLYDYGAIESHDVTVRYSGDVATQTGTVVMSVAARGAPKTPITLLFTLVWKCEAAVVGGYGSGKRHGWPDAIARWASPAGQ